MPPAPESMKSASDREAYLGIHTEIMADSSSAGPGNGEALRLFEPAIRFLSPYAAHITVDNGVGVILSSGWVLCSGVLRTQNSMSLLYLVV